MDRVRRQLGLEQISFTSKETINIAVLDSGIAYHPDLQSSSVVFKDFVNRRNNYYDDNGHGTHVCGIIAGDGRLSQGRYRGIAPGVGLVVGKVLDRNGRGNFETLLESLNWVLEMSRKIKIHIINISIGMSEVKDRYMIDEIESLIDSIWKNGILIICAAGNTGPGTGTISPICYNHKIMAVGCNDGEYYKNSPLSCKNYSSCGYIHSIKPDLVAPGTEIMSCNYLFDHGKRRYDGKSNMPYIKKSGTSMATAIVSGCVALYFEKQGSCNPAQMQRKIQENCIDLGELRCKQGWGMINPLSLISENKKSH